MIGIGIELGKLLGYNVVMEGKWKGSGIWQYKFSIGCKFVSFG